MGLSEIERGIHKVYVFLVQLLPKQLHGLTEALEMDDFPFPQELDDIIYIRIIGQPQDVVIGHAGFLLRAQIFCQICHRVPFDLHHSRIVYRPGCRGGIDTCGVIHKIGSKGRILDLGILQIPCQLMHDGSHHLQMAQFFCTDMGNKMTPETPVPGVFLGEYSDAFGKIPGHLREFGRSLSPNELKHPSDMHQQRIFDRMLEMCVPVCFNGESLRQGKVTDKLKIYRQLTAK